MSVESVKKKHVLIATHNGTFHCDDALAVFLIKLLPENKYAKVVRTRDKQLLDQCDFVLDVGAVYDHETRRYDHHQPSFNHTMNSIIVAKPFCIKLSSAGLVYTHYGHRIISTLSGLDENSPEVDAVFDKVYEKFVQEIDAIDNGIAMCSETPVYEIHTNISTRVKHFLPSWREESNDQILFERFEKAMQMVGNEFVDRVSFYINDWLPAKKVVEKAIMSRFEVDESGTIIDLTSAGGGVPWKEHLFCIEKEVGIENAIKFVIFEDKDWRVMSVPISSYSFQLRNALHEEWRGLRDEELSNKSGIDGCVFVHINGFIGGNRTRSGALQMAKSSLKSV
ncbi:UPF0160 protein MYG1: mitochondrial-like isoform X2 [Dinothrombium tinctorium]|uniref:UPF0160 protein MYG1: mitochondrial-like isoform X2 n=1 Tax=Dinothrombium tinctorium TaxID=1965070 RepID=A0A3S3P2M9_9ACAR|nr:UPF0160 protein MYG1: mitochondrial-like isoform X2 [Dinothrombium tinctorium]RWS03843.1 UPF0160 protein MYG1: mitochondrial-like isoform X2 [Dinothrombium tinctorium]